MCRVVYYRVRFHNHAIGAIVEKNSCTSLILFIKDKYILLILKNLVCYSNSMHVVRLVHSRNREVKKRH